MVFLSVALLSLPAFAAANQAWTLVQTPHFQVYSQAGEREGRSTALWLEQLRAFFAAQPMPGADQRFEQTSNAKVIEFRSPAEYAEFRLRAASDGYFLGTESSDYIVLPTSGQEHKVVAHEYVHLVLHSLGLKLPPWFCEGLADVYSTVRMGDGGSSIGTDLPARRLVLRQRRWIPIGNLLEIREDSPLRSDRADAEVFYAESWALTDMLLFSPEYSARASQLWRALEREDFDSRQLSRLYSKPVADITADLRSWIGMPRPGVAVSIAPRVFDAFRVSPLSDFQSRLLMAEVVFACGDRQRAQHAFVELEKEQPDNARIAAFLGEIALQTNDRKKACEQWRRALELGIDDANLCYRYALVAEDIFGPTDDVIAALRRAIALRPGFDDARFKLGLIESNRGNYQGALEQLLAMQPQSISRDRAYGYWIAVANAFCETGARPQAKQAASKAVQFAKTPEQRSAALQIAYIADTDLTVQFSRDANGNLQMVTARKPHGSTDWNPFIQPDDDIRTMTGSIRKVECRSGQISGFTIATPAKTIDVSLPDASHVLISGGTAEFVCDAADGRLVTVQYAASDKQRGSAGILRGMQFH